MKNYNFAELINKSLYDFMKTNEKSVSMGLGHNDPKRIFNTTKNLLENFGESRCIEPPTSENALTGICFGMALKGFSVCLTHQRFDFALLSFDQIINTISKWKFMFSKNTQISILIRLIVGRGWGQGPTHSQSYHSFLSSIPGLDVYYPFTPYEAYQTVQKGLSSGNPTVMIEHRWLHGSNQKISDFRTKDNWENTRILSEGGDLTIFTYGYMCAEALEAKRFLAKYDISLEIITFVRLQNKATDILIKSLKKTNHFLIIEPFMFEGSLSSSIASQCMKKLIENQIILKSFDILSLPFAPESTSFFKTKDRYINSAKIINKVGKIFKIDTKKIEPIGLHDIPGEWFRGPF